MAGTASNDKNLELLSSLIENWEDETIEFKEAGNDFDTNNIGRYISALSNEANLAERPSGWLVFGVRNRTRAVVGTEYRADPKRLDGLKKQINDGTEPSMTFRSIREVAHPGGRVIMFEIPAAPQGMPIAWKGHWYARAGENLAHLQRDHRVLDGRAVSSSYWGHDQAWTHQSCDLAARKARVGLLAQPVAGRTDLETRRTGVRL